jgi:hypothetical protein
MALHRKGAKNAKDGRRACPSTALGDIPALQVANEGHQEARATSVSSSCPGSEGRRWAKAAERRGRRSAAVTVTRSSCRQRPTEDVCGGHRAVLALGRKRVQ